MVKKVEKIKVGNREMYSINGFSTGNKEDTMLIREIIDKKLNKEIKKEPKKDRFKELKNKTVKELREMASKLKIKYYYKMKEDKLIKLIMEAEK